jgi:hypothetical protein
MDNDCKACGGLGVIERNDKAYECQCSFIKRISAAMPLYIRKADVRKEHLDHPIMGMMRRNMMVVSSWTDMKAIIKGMWIANPTKLIKITSDREIRDVYVGSKSRAARGDEDGKIYNSLEDLMDIPDLSIVRLNELSYKNKAASGALEEAISYRTDRDKPTWLFSDIDRPFTIGSHAYSDSVADLIKSNFHMMRISRINQYNNTDFEDLNPLAIKTSDEPKNVPVPIEPVPEPERPPIAASPEPKKKPRIRPSEDSEIDTGLSIYGSGITTSSKFKRKS